MIGDEKKNGSGTGQVHIPVIDAEEQESTGRFKLAPAPYPPVLSWCARHISFLALLITWTVAVIGVVGLWGLSYHDATAHAPILHRITAIESHQLADCEYRRWTGRIMRSMAKNSKLPEASIDMPDPCPAKEANNQKGGNE